MINGMHALIYTTKPDEMRRFFREALQLSHVDAGNGWLIFALPPSEVALHPTEIGEEHHELTLVCDDIDATVRELRERGVTFADAVVDRRWGRAIQMALPDGGQMMLYQPEHPLAAAGQ